MISLRSLFRSSLIYGIGSAVMRIMTFLLLPIYTNTLNGDGGDWYGNYAIIITTIAFLRICYSHGTGDSFLKLYSQADGKNKDNIISTYIIYILMVIMVVSSMLLLFNLLMGAQNNATLIGLLQQYLYHILLIVVCDTLNYRVIDILRIKNYALYYNQGPVHNPPSSVPK